MDESRSYPLMGQLYCHEHDRSGLGSTMRRGLLKTMWCLGLLAMMGASGCMSYPRPVMRPYWDSGIYDGWNLAIALNSDSWTPLHTAALYGRHDQIKVLLDSGGNVNARIGAVKEWHRDISMTNQFAGFTPLHCSMLQGSHEVVRLLLTHGADVNATNVLGYTPLYYAAHEGHARLVRGLLDGGAVVDSQNCKGQTPLMQGIDHDQVFCVLLSRGADISLRDNTRATVLHYAAGRGSLRTVRTLVARGADVNASTSCGVRPLHCAVESSIDKTRYLLDHGADVNAVVREHQDVGFMPGFTALHFAMRSGRSDIVALLLKRGAKTDVSIVGIDPIDREMVENWTPLHFATELTNPDIAKLLLQAGADVNAKDNMGHTPLYYATRQNHEKLVSLLLRYGAKQ